MQNMTLNITYFHKYFMTYDLITTCLQRELQTHYLRLHHLPNLNALLSAVENNKIDILLINSSWFFPRNGNQKNAFRYLPSSANGDRTLRPKYEAGVAEENGEFRHEYSGQPP